MASAKAPGQGVKVDWGPPGAGTGEWGVVSIGAESGVKALRD